MQNLANTRELILVGLKMTGEVFEAQRKEFMVIVFCENRFGDIAYQVLEERPYDYVNNLN